MPSYRELLQQVKGEIEEIDAARTAELRETDSPVLVDVRERSEWDEGYIRGHHVPAATRIRSSSGARRERT